MKNLIRDFICPLLILSIITFSITYSGYIIFNNIKTFSSKTDKDNQENPFSPRTKYGLDYIAESHYSIFKIFRYDKSKNDAENSVNLFKFVEEINGELFFQNNQSIKTLPNFWIACNKKNFNIIKKGVIYYKDNSYEIKPVASMGKYKLNSFSPNFIEIFLANYLEDKIVVGLVDRCLIGNFEDDSRWLINAPCGTKEYYGVIKISDSDY